MAQLIIRAVGHWMDKLTEEEVITMSKKDPRFLDAYNARPQKGDVIAIRDDDQGLGKEECLPHFLVIKVDGKKTDLDYLTEPKFKNVLMFDDVKMESYTEERLELKRQYNFDIDKNLTAEQLDEIKNSEWLVETVTLDTIKDKTLG